MSLQSLPKMDRAELYLFAGWYKTHKAAPEQMVPLPGPGEAQTPISPAEVMALMEEFVEWDSVIPDYMTEVTARYLTWRDLALAALGGGVS